MPGERQLAVTTSQKIATTDDDTRQATPDDLPTAREGARVRAGKTPD